MKYLEIDGIRYETLSLFRKVFNRAVINPLINYIVPTKLLLNFLNKSKSPLLHESISRPGGWRAMKLCYENGEPVDAVDKRILKDAVLTLSARNRRRMAVRVLKDLIQKYRVGGDVHIVGIGTGPGFNVLEAMVDAETDRVFAYCIDEDSDAFSFGEKLAEQMGLKGRVRYITGNAINLEGLLEVVPHVVKMVGILEYLTDDQVMELLRMSHRILPPGGSVLVNSITAHHGVDRYLRRVFNWHLNYRSPRKILSLFEESGFSDFHLRQDPLGVYAILVGSKN
ncbi:MAG: class I SAM-dependent methyltransferase family protein [Candidatus Aureabacteria bacterium]|nr:class I SAM-dependent methyltransferase family protein [Candidatus Auribacterota bacterium]